MIKKYFGFVFKSLLIVIALLVLQSLLQTSWLILLAPVAMGYVFNKSVMQDRSMSSAKKIVIGLLGALSLIAFISVAYFLIYFFIYKAFQIALCPLFDAMPFVRYMLFPFWWLCP